MPHATTRCVGVDVHHDSRAVSAQQARRQRRDTELREQGQGWRLAPVVPALQALRRVQFTVAVPLSAERGDLSRVENPRPLLR